MKATETKKKYAIIVKEIDVILEVSKRTYYKIFNNEIGSVKPEGYEISLESFKKYKKLYNSIRSL